MKLKFAAVVLLPVLCLLLFVGVVLAQANGSIGAIAVPAPYTGMKNPLSWNDTASQAQGKKVYSIFCSGCHGNTGSFQGMLVNFSLAGYPKLLESNADYGFWRVSEGTVTPQDQPNYMQSFKGSLTETQRWQVLTYIWSLGAASPAATANATPNATTGTPASTTTSNLPSTAALSLTTPVQAQVGQTILVSALVVDKTGKPIANVPITFSLNTTFFGNGLAEIGQVTTNDKGVANVTCIAAQASNLTIDARSLTDNGSYLVATAIVRLTAGSSQYYQVHVGVNDAGFPPGLVIFPGTAQAPSAPGSPLNVLRIPGGLPFIPFVGYLLTIILVWSLYTRVVYQVLRVPYAGKVKGFSARLVPTIFIVLVVLTGAMLVFVLVTGPYSGPYTNPY
jgi:mono/diheme cytochrome c family protein